jgi:hypothetical protein
MSNIGSAKMSTYYEAVCRDKDGNHKWTAHVKNVVVTEGLNALITACFKTIPGSVAWYIGLKGTAVALAAGDTLGSHGAWTELTGYSEGVRQTWNVTTNSVANGSLSNSNNKARFTASGAMTVTGLLLCSNSTKGGTSGTLYGGGPFNEGDRSMVANDTLDVTGTVSATAS